MNFIKIAGRDISSIFKNRFIRVSVTAIIIVPLLYSLLYLYAFWDPYNKLTDMQVAVVNLDKGSTKDGEAVNYGKDLVDKLKDNKKVGWRFVSKEDAEEGVRSKGYYAMFVVPEDFSQRVLSAKDGKPEQPHILYTANEKKNFLAAQINGKVLVELKSELVKNITDEYTKVTFDSLYEVKDGMQKAADGSKELYDGIGKLNDKVPELKDGVNKLKDGSLQLRDGLGSAKEGTAQLYYGANRLNSALRQTKDGAGQLYGGLGQLNGQLPVLKDGIVKLSDGSTALGLGMQQFNIGIKALNDGINTTAVDTNGNPLGLVSGVNKLGSGVNALNTSVNTTAADSNGNPLGLAKGVESLYNAVTKPQTGLADGVKYLYDGLTKVSADPAQDGIAHSLSTVQVLLNAGDPVSVAAAKQIVAGLVSTTNTHSSDPAHPTFLDGVTAINNGVNVSNINAQGKPAPSLKAAVTAINAGINTGSVDVNGNPVMSLSGAVQTMNASINGVKDSSGNVIQAGLVQGTGLLGSKVSNELLPGFNQLLSGTAQLSDGINSLNSKVPALVTGVNSLYSGAGDLNGGMKQIYDGSTTLKNSIAKPEEVKAIPEKETASDTTLFNGMAQLNDGATKLNNGLNTLSGNIPELQDGVNKLYDGSKELSDKLKEGSDKINKNLVNDSKTMAEFVSEPLTIDEKPMYPVKNYGTGFTPYFVPLSLWVGALMMFFVITEKVDDDIEAGPVSLVLGKFLSYGYIGIIQAVLASSIVLLLGLRPSSIILYFLFNIFLSFVFIAIIQSLIFLLGDAGRLLAIILLIFQLTAGAGTFPLEVVPKFFKVLNPFMPFTYATSGLREVISGIDYSVFMKDVIVLAAIMAAFIIISVLMKEHADKVKDKMLQRKESASI